MAADCFAGVRARLGPAGLAAGSFAVVAQSDWAATCCLSKGSLAESEETAESLAG